MKLFTVPALLAAALCSVVAVIPFLPTATSAPRPFAIEARLASSVTGTVKIYYDLGQGLQETDSFEQTLVKGGATKTYRFPLPAGTFRGFRFDPIDGPGTVTLSSELRITTERGRLIRTIGYPELRPLEQIASIREVNRGLEIVTTPTAHDPQLGVVFEPPLVLVFTSRDLGELVFFRALSVFAPLALLLFAADRWKRIQTAAIRASGWMRKHPSRAVIIVSAISVIASSYPVVFLGKSYVSPNFATPLLYNSYPTLPGDTNTVTATGMGSDMGATMWQHVPYSFMQRRALAQGELPWWNRYNSTGTPLFAQGQSMFGDPLHFLVLFFDGASWAWDIKYLIAKFLFAMALGLTVVAIVRPPVPPDVGERERPDAITLGSALLVTAAAPFVGFFVYRINHAAIFSVCYAPWTLYCWVRIMQAGGRKAVTLWVLGLFAGNLALINSGTVKEAYVLLLLMNATGAALIFFSQQPWGTRIGKLAAAAWSAILLALITAPLWMTFLQTLQHAFTVSHPLASQIQPSLLLGAFDELFFRPLSLGGIVFNPSINFLLLLGLLYFLATLPLHFANRTLMVIAVGAVGALAFTFGLVPPRWIVKVPLLANIGHIENCFLCGLIVLWSVLAGAGFAAAARRLRTGEGRIDLVIGATLLFAVVFAWIGFSQAAHRTATPGATFSLFPLGEALPVPSFVWYSLVAVLLASILLAVVVRHAFLRRTLGPAGAILAGMCVLIFVWRHGMHVGGSDVYNVKPPARASFHTPSPAIDFVQARQTTEPGRVFGLHGTLTSGWNAVYGLEAIYGPDALQNPWMRQLIDVSPVQWNSSWRLYLNANDVSKARPFLDALNVRYYLDARSDQKLLGRDLNLAKVADLDVYESRTAWPRAFFTNRLDSHVDPGDLMKKFVASNGRPFASVSVDERAQDAGLQRLSRVVTPATFSPAVDYRLTENSTSFKVHAPEPGVIVLTEAWWKDSFRASVDGRRVPLVRVNHAFKGMLVDTAGDHRVTIWYWPRNFLRSLSMSGAGAVLLAFSLFLGLRPARAA